MRRQYLCLQGAMPLRQFSCFKLWSANWIVLFFLCLHCSPSCGFPAPRSKQPQWIFSMEGRLIYVKQIHSPSGACKGSRMMNQAHIAVVVITRTFDHNNNVYSFIASCSILVSSLSFLSSWLLVCPLSLLLSVSFLLPISILNHSLSSSLSLFGFPLPLNLVLAPPLFPVL